MERSDGLAWEAHRLTDKERWSEMLASLVASLTLKIRHTCRDIVLMWRNTSKCSTPVM